jgi:hypothetical protein
MDNNALSPQQEGNDTSTGEVPATGKNKPQEKDLAVPYGKKIYAYGYEMPEKKYIKGIEYIRKDVVEEMIDGLIKEIENESNEALLRGGLFSQFAYKKAIIMIKEYLINNKII